MKLLKERWDFVATNVMIEFYLYHFLNALELMAEILQGKVLMTDQWCPPIGHLRLRI